MDCWLGLLAGSKKSLLDDWLATVHDLTWPTAAIYFQGQKDVGKGMFAAAVARGRGSSVTNYDDIATGFNSALRDCPIVFLDEGSAPVVSGSAGFRSLIGETSRRLEEKYYPTATLHGAVRLIIAANNADALKIREDLSPEDEAAIGERVLHILVPQEAAHYLISLGGREATADWVTNADGSAGKIPQHIRFLQENRQVRRGPRFAVHGDVSDWISAAARRPGLPQDMLLAIANALVRQPANDHPRYERAPEGPFADCSSMDCKAVWIGDSEALVSTSRIFKAWRFLTGRERRPTMPRIADALKTVSTKEDRPVIKKKRVYVKHVPATRILDVAEQLGLDDIDRLKQMFGLEG